MRAQSNRLNLLFKKGLCRIYLVVALSVAASVGANAEEDPYLSLLSREASKLDGAAPQTGEQAGSQPAAADGGPGIEAFEEDLKTRYRGTYAFYLKLPRRMREEVYDEYRGGASIGEIRNKVMNRFLNQ